MDILDIRKQMEESFTAMPGIRPAHFFMPTKFMFFSTENNLFIAKYLNKPSRDDQNSVRFGSEIEKYTKQFNHVYVFVRLEDWRESGEEPLVCINGEWHSTTNEVLELILKYDFGRLREKIEYINTHPIERTQFSDLDTIYHFREVAW